MNELYFRTWDSATRKMTYHSPGRLTYTYVPQQKHPIVATVQVRMPAWVTNSTLEFMEWTRRVDRNGRKIYEGDIISTPYGLSPVIWSWEGCCWKTRFAEAPLLSMIPTDRMEVAGNFRQNGELLE